MFGPLDFVLGGLTPLAAAAVAFALAWRAGRSGGAAWSAGVVVGFAAGVLALEARDDGMTRAAWGLVRPTESHGWLPLVALAGAVPALGARLAGRRWLEGALALPLSLAVPALLLWSKYRATQRLREAGFAEDAVTPAGAAAVLGAIAVATLAAWWLWRRAVGAPLAKTRTLLAIIATVGAAAAAGLSGALVYAQTFGVLAAAMGGCALAAWAFKDASGLSAARGPLLLVFGGLLALAVVYSDLPIAAAALLAVALALPVGCLRALARRGPAAQAAVRAVLCLAPLGAALWQAAAVYYADQQHEEQADDEPYFR
jgi:hypothetical protein